MHSVFTGAKWLSFEMLYVDIAVDYTQLFVPVMQMDRK